MNTLDRYSPVSGILLIMLTFLLAALIAAAGRQQARAELAATPALPILYLPTSVPTVQPTDMPIVVQSAPTVAAPTPIVIERQVIVQVVVTTTPEPAQLQTLSIPENEEPLSPALLREAQDK